MPARGIALMGVCNVTPDSFSDGGRTSRSMPRARAWTSSSPRGPTSSTSAAESTRPGATPVPPREQLARVLDVVRYAADRGAASRSTRRAPRSPRPASTRARSSVNDVSCLRDAELARVVAQRRGAALILMHARGHAGRDGAASARTPTTRYGDVVARRPRASGSAAAERATLDGAARGARSSWTPGSASRRTRGRASSSSARTRRARGRALGRARARRGEPQVVPRASSTADASARPSASAPRSPPRRPRGARGRRILRVHDVRATRQAIDLASLPRRRLAGRSA